MKSTHIDTSLKKNLNVHLLSNIFCCLLPDYLCVKLYLGLMQIIELDLTKVLRVKSPQEVSICSNQVSGLVNYLVVDLCRVIWI